MLFHGAAGAKLSGARANDLIVDGKFRHARAFDPLRKKVAHILAGHLRRQLFEIVDRSILAAVTVRGTFAAVDRTFPCPSSRAACERPSRLCRKRSTGKRPTDRPKRRARARSTRSARKSARVPVVRVARHPSAPPVNVGFAKGKRAPLSEALRNPGIVERLQADGLAPPLISNFTLHLFLGTGRGLNQKASTPEKSFPDP